MSESGRSEQPKDRTGTLLKYFNRAFFVGVGAAIAFQHANLKSNHDQPPSAPLTIKPKYPSSSLTGSKLLAEAGEITQYNYVNSTKNVYSTCVGAAGTMAMNCLYSTDKDPVTIAVQSNEVDPRQPYMRDVVIAIEYSGGQAAAKALCEVLTEPNDLSPSIRQRDGLQCIPLPGQSQDEQPPLKFITFPV